MDLRPGLSCEDGWYAVEKIDAWTFAIGEPNYHQQNWSYLLRGDSRALLFDTGSFCRDITGVVARLTGLPVTAFPSHMHYDHLGNITRFERTAIADLPNLRACFQDGLLTPIEEIFLGSHENNAAPSFPVGEWIEIGSMVDLGGRRLEVLHAPGHSPDSVALLDRENNFLFAADFIYPGQLYAQVPGADLEDYLATATALASQTDARTRIYCAHGNVAAGDLHAAPLLQRGDLLALGAALARFKADARQVAGAPPWTLEISDQLTMIVGEDAARCWL